MTNDRYCNGFIAQVWRRAWISGVATLSCAALKHRLLLRSGAGLRCKYSQSCVFTDVEAEEVGRRCFQNRHRDVHHYRHPRPIFHFAHRSAPGTGMEYGKGDVVSGRGGLERHRGQQELDGLAAQCLPCKPSQRGNMLATGPHAAMLIEDHRSRHARQCAPDWSRMAA